MQLAGVTGVILVTAECLRSRGRHPTRSARADLGWGVLRHSRRAAVPAELGRHPLPAVGAARFLGEPGSPRVTPRSCSGERSTGCSAPRSTRSSLASPQGMLLPLAVYLAMYDTKRSALGRWFPVICIATAATASVSRSAVLAIVVSMGVFVVAMRPVHRVNALVSDAGGGGGHLRDLARTDRHPQVILPGRDERPVHRPPGEHLSVCRADGGQDAVVRPGRWHVHRSRPRSTSSTTST